MIDDRSTANVARAGEIARRLLGRDLKAVSAASGGRNSRVYRVMSANGESFALKLYPPVSTDSADRRATEVRALTLFEEAGIKPVPRLVATDAQANCSLLSWIPGEPLDTVESGDLAGAVEFITAVHAAKSHPLAAAQCGAVESCLSGREVRRQIERRIADLAALDDEPALHAFLADKVQPEWQRYLALAKSRASRAGVDLEVDLTRRFQTLAPSDFGFHNALRLVNGSLAFVDFEYFGWDDPVKLSADLLLHPATPLELSARLWLRKELGAVYADDPHFDARLEALFPLYAIRWTLILLNEYIPRNWRRRVLAGEMDSWAAAKSRQLDRARGFLASLPTWLALAS